MQIRHHHVPASLKTAHRATSTAHGIRQLHICRSDCMALYGRIQLISASALRAPVDAGSPTRGGHGQVPYANAPKLTPARV